MSGPSVWSSLEAKKYLSLETFKKNGAGVRTPVWFAAAPASTSKLYIYTIDNTGKVKRIRYNGRVRIAPCDMRGTVQGDWMEAHAEIVTGPEAVQGTRLLNKKYWPWKQIMAFFALFSPRKRVIIAISPA